ncbi:MAG: aldo/keto reductase [Prevotella sp.]|nr:aldo/keto reductase [Prevotella sp.]
MEYRELGKTGLRVSKLGFGASSLGGVFHSFDENRGIDAVFTAVDEGINFIDVSPYYGYYKAETVLGKALKDIPHDKFILSTKVGRYGEDGHNSWDYSAERVTRSVYESMERLHLDYVDILYVHDIEFADLNQIANETLPALHRLKEEGVVKHVGCTDLQLENLKWIIEHTEPGSVECLLNFCHYCLCDDKLVDFLDFFEKNGVGVSNASPFSMGLLTERGVPDWHPAPKPLVRACEEAAQYCKEKGYPIEKLAMQFSVSNPRIASTIFSTTRPENLKKNLAYIEEPIDWDLVAKVREIIGDQQRVSWANT